MVAALFPDQIILISSIIFLLVACAIPNDIQLTKVIKTTSGNLQGFWKHVTYVGHTVQMNDRVQAFLGIPYAAPPVGSHHRFKPPTKYSWNGVWNQAAKQPNSCMQSSDESFDRFQGAKEWNVPITVSNISENCLYLNIWVPTLCNSSITCDVMLWIYGGSFSSGAVSLPLYDGAILAASANLIVVSVNYRIGPFGFLYLNCSDVPGNAGLLDQQFAMSWIKRNAARFHGNPNNICLVGESAGAMSIAYHLQSQKSSSLFNKAILMSGNYHVAQAFISPQQALFRASELAKCASCPTEPKEMMKSCLQFAPASILAECSRKVTCDPLLCMPFVPTIDWNGLVSHHPDRLRLVTKRHPVIIGVTRNEASYFIMYMLQNLRRSSMFSRQIPLDFHKTPTMNVSRSLFNYITSQFTGLDRADLRKHMSYYCNNYHLKPRCSWHNDVSENSQQTSTNASFQCADQTLVSLEECMSDFLINCPSLRFVDQLVGLGNRDIFLYKLNHRAAGISWPEWTGVLHGYDIHFLFGRYLTSHAETDDKKVSDLMMRMFANFIKDGEPSDSFGVYWPRYRRRERFYLEISTEPKVKSNFKDVACYWWNTIVPRLRCDAAAKLTDSTSASSPLEFQQLVLFLLVMLFLPKPTDILNW